MNTNELCELLKVSRATLYRSVRGQKNFPKAVRIGRRKLVWDKSEVEWWFSTHAPKA